MAEAQVPVQGAVPATQALVQHPAAPANVDNPQQNPSPLQVLISFLVICSLHCFSFSPTHLRLVIPRGRLLVPFSSLHKHQVSVVLLFSLRPLPQFAHVLSLFVMFLCASPHKHRVCAVLLISLRLPCPVWTPFICHILCASPHKRRVCVVLLISLRLPYPVCTHFICHVLCASPHKHQVCVVLLISLRLPYPVCAHFICHVLCASPHKHRVCVVL